MTDAEFRAKLDHWQKLEAAWREQHQLFKQAALRLWEIYSDRWNGAPYAIREMHPKFCWPSDATDGGFELQATRVIIRVDEFDSENNTVDLAGCIEFSLEDFHAALDNDTAKLAAIKLNIEEGRTAAAGRLEAKRIADAQTALETAIAKRKAKLEALQKELALGCHGCIAGWPKTGDGQHYEPNSYPRVLMTCTTAK